MRLSVLPISILQMHINGKGGGRERGGERNIERKEGEGGERGRGEREGGRGRETYREKYPNKPNLKQWPK
jgi:hypothetical protein